MDSEIGLKMTGNGPMDQILVEHMRETEMKLEYKYSDKLTITVTSGTHGQNPEELVKRLNWILAELKEVGIRHENNPAR
jgi:hypothetical protein